MFGKGTLIILKCIVAAWNGKNHPPVGGFNPSEKYTNVSSDDSSKKNIGKPITKDDFGVPLS